MSISINFKLTQAGQAAIWNAGNTGVSLNLTHVQLGSGNKAPIDGLETALISPQQAVAIAGGSRVGNNQIRMSAIFTGTTSFNIAEVGLWAGVPNGSGSVLVAYWSQAAGNLAVKSSGVDFVFSHDMYLNGSVPAGSITILADQTQSGMLAALANHEAKTDPHPQYTTDAEVIALIEARVGDYVVAGGTPNDITAMLVPAVTSYNANTAFAFKAAATNTGAITLDAGGGANPLVREDGTPMQAGDVLAGMVVTAVYDVASTSFRATEMVSSQVDRQIALSVQTQVHTAYTTAGTAPEFVVTLPAGSVALAALSENLRLRLKFHAAGVGDITLNIAGLGAKSLKQYDSTGAKVGGVIAAGQLVDVEYDGTDFVLLDPLPAATGQTPAQFDNSQKLATTAFLKAAGLQTSGQKNVAAATSLLAADAGKTINLNGTVGTVFLPLTTTVPAGSIFTLFPQNAGWVLSTSGAENINWGNGSTTSRTLNAGDTLILTTDGAGSWIAIGGSAQIGYSLSRHSITPANRVANTNYTNTTGKVMWVQAVFAQTSAFHAYSTGTGPSMGDAYDTGNAGYGRRIIFPVLPGETYGWSYNAGLAVPTLNSWTETY